jgi:Icc-related predicted phosphoesterase
MRVLVVSELHGDLDAGVRARAHIQPDLILSCGDWGDPDQVREADLTAFVDVVPVYTTFGNHDPLDFLSRLRNRDGLPILPASGSVRDFAGLRLAAVGGIWAMSYAKAHHFTDADVAETASRITQAGPVEILISSHQPRVDPTEGHSHAG